MKFLNELKELIEHYESLEKKEHFEQIDPKSLSGNRALDLPNHGVSTEEMIEQFKEILDHAPSTARNDFFNQLFGGREESAVLGDMMASYINSTMFTYNVGGIQILTENRIIEKIIELTGYKSGWGMFLPGGSMGNLSGLIAARNAKFPEARDSGIQDKCTAYVSEIAHYSIRKNANIIGIGRQAVRKIPVDSHGKMRVDLLEKTILEDKEQGYTPLIVVATAGTTVLGSFDPISAISAVCKKYDIWLHTDGALGGGVFFSKTSGELVKDKELADSYTFNFHKLMGVPQQCTLFLVKNKQNLYQIYSEQTCYQTPAEYDYSPVSYHLLCGRRNDALKVWCLWQTYGTKGLGERVDKQFELAKQFAKLVKSYDELELLMEPESIIVCFKHKSLDSIEICNQLNSSNLAKIGYCSFQGETYIRQVCINPKITENDYEKLLKHIIDL